MDDVLEMLSPHVVRTVLLGFGFLFLFYLVFKKEQNRKMNFSMFYSFLWTCCSLFVVNALCVNWDMWNFSEENSTLIPDDIFFDWAVFWGVVIPFFWKGRHLVLTAVSLFWLDILFMPLLEKVGVLNLSSNWLIGEVLLILFVFVPGQLWFYFSLNDQKVKWRSLFQVLVMAFFLFVAIPFLVDLYYPIQMGNSNVSNTIWIQLVFIIALPSLISVVDLAEKGAGTPFPYDATKRVVRSGVYAYIRNPIQWSFTLIFIPLAFFFQSPLLLVGSVMSVAYVVGVSNPNEYDSMKQRYGSVWTSYKNNVPAWYFKWTPDGIPAAKLYYNQDCEICTSLANWLKRRKPFSLELVEANRHQSTLKSLRYESLEDVQYSSVAALASSFEHINLAWASLGWLMRLPGVKQILQAIVNTMGIGVGGCVANK